MRIGLSEREDASARARTSQARTRVHAGVGTRVHAGVGVAILALRGVRMRVGVHACSGAHGACAHALVEEREHVGRVCRRSVEAHGGVEFGRHEVLGVGDLTRSTLQASPITRLSPNTTGGTLAA
jgi:hypothetical protein